MYTYLHSKTHIHKNTDFVNKQTYAGQHETLILATNLDPNKEHKS